MLLLHGIYHNGEIAIKEKNLPEGKAPVEIKVFIRDGLKNRLNKVGGLIRKNAFSREEIYEDRI